MASPTVSIPLKNDSDRHHYKCPDSANSMLPSSSTSFGTAPILLATRPNCRPLHAHRIRLTERPLCCIVGQADDASVNWQPSSYTHSSLSASLGAYYSIAPYTTHLVVLIVLSILIIAVASPDGIHSNPITVVVVNGLTARANDAFVASAMVPKSTTTNGDDDDAMPVAARTKRNN